MKSIKIDDVYIYIYRYLHGKSTVRQAKKKKLRFAFTHSEHPKGLELSADVRKILAERDVAAKTISPELTEMVKLWWF